MKPSNHTHTNKQTNKQTNNQPTNQPIKQTNKPNKQTNKTNKQTNYKSLAVLDKNGAAHPRVKSQSVHMSRFQSGSIKAPPQSFGLLLQGLANQQPLLDVFRSNLRTSRPLLDTWIESADLSRVMEHTGPRTRPFQRRSSQDAESRCGRTYSPALLAFELL